MATKTPLFYTMFVRPYTSGIGYQDGLKTWKCPLDPFGFYTPGPGVQWRHKVCPYERTYWIPLFYQLLFGMVIDLQLKYIEIFNNKIMNLH